MAAAFRSWNCVFSLFLSPGNWEGGGVMGTEDLAGRKPEGAWGAAAVAVVTWVVTPVMLLGA